MPFLSFFLPNKTRRHGVRHSSMPRRLFGLVMAIGIGLVASSCSDGMKGDARPHAGVAKAHRLPIHGIDVSKWQGDINWHAVKAAGTKFAYIKSTEGGDHIDSKFYENWRNAERAGVPRGAYHFVFWCRPAEEQAEWFRRNVPADPNALPPVLDAEWNGHSRNCPKKIPREQALQMMQIILDAMEEHTGKRPIIYTDITFHQEVLEGVFNDYPYWIRSTAAEPHMRYNSRRWTFWQFTTTGRVPGIKGDVDRNAFYGSESEWKTFMATHCEPRDIDRLQRIGLCVK